MPELPEVETIAQDINRHLKGEKITDFKVMNERTRRARPFLSLSEAKFKKKVLGRKIVKIFRQAKMLIFDLGDLKMVFHLKMTGQLVLLRKDSKWVAGGHPIALSSTTLPNKFSRAFFHFSNGADLYFNDVRRFGWIKLLSQLQYKEEFNTLGHEPLGQDFNISNFEAKLERRKNTTIKQALLDQSLVVGIGNIYADESLFDAKIKPYRIVKTLTKERKKLLWRAIPKILKRSIKHRGTSFSDYRDGHGRPGNFLNYLKVYGRGGKSCYVCGNMIKKDKLGGRGTHWCDHCQK